LIRPSGRSKSSRLALNAARIATIFGLGLFALSGPASSEGITPNTVSPVQHFLDCFGALITDPVAHAASCVPGHDVFVSGSTGYGTAPCRLPQSTQGLEVTGDSFDDSCGPTDDD
jgi:hypothetical protein